MLTNILKKRKLLIFMLFTGWLEEKLDEKLKQNYKTIDNSRISLYPDKEKDKALLLLLVVREKIFILKRSD